MPDALRFAIGFGLVVAFAWHFRQWFEGSAYVRRGLLFRLGGAFLGALMPLSIELGIAVGYVAGIFLSLLYNMRYDS